MHACKLINPPVSQVAESDTSALQLVLECDEERERSDCRETSRSDVIAAWKKILDLRLIEFFLP